MMDNWKRWLLIVSLSFLATFTGMADALRCYQCDSGTYSGCQETEFNPRGIPIVEYHDDDFSDTCPLCQKATFNGRTARECSPPGTNVSVGCHGFICYCNTDTCNHAVTITTTPATLLTIVTMVFQTLFV